MDDMAQACWEAIDEALPGEPAILVGCSVGSAIVPYMHLQHPGRTPAMVLSGTGYNPAKEFAARRIKAYTERGIDYRWGYTFEDLSPAFRATPLAHFFADMFAERNCHADLQSILYQFEALAKPDAEDHHGRIRCPTIILSGSEGQHASGGIRAESPHSRLEKLNSAIAVIGIDIGKNSFHFIGLDKCRACCGRIGRAARCKRGLPICDAA
jgi:pimeloyl-ACP methyl ester carboxylesterase